MLSKTLANSISSNHHISLLPIYLSLPTIFSKFSTLSKLLDEIQLEEI